MNSSATLPPAAPRKLAVSDKLRLFIIVSVLLHFGIAAIWGLPEYFRRKAEERLALEAKEQQKRIEEAEKKAIEIRKEQVREETKKEAVEELKKDFDQIVAQDLNEEDRTELWEDLLDQLMSDLDDYALQMHEAGLTDADVRNLLGDLKKDMVNALLDKLRKMTAKQIAEQFIAKVKDEVAPAVSKHFENEIKRQVGEPLKQEGQKLVREETTFVERTRKEIERALEGAEQDARRAAKDLEGAKQRVADAGKANEKKSDAAKEQAAAGAKNEEKNVAAAEAQLKAAGDKLAEASKHAEGAAKEKAESASRQEGPAAAKEAGEARAAAHSGDAAATQKEAGEASEAAKNLAGAAEKAQGDVAKSAGDAKEKAAAAAALGQAKAQAAAAAATLEGVKDRLAKADQASKQAAEQGDKQVERTAKNEEATADRADKALEKAGAQLAAASEKAAAFGEKLQEQVKAAVEGEAKAARKEAGETKEAAQSGDAKKAEQEAGEAAAAAEKLAQAAGQAKEAAKKAEFDPAALARAALKEARDGDIKAMLKDGFEKEFAEHTLPRLSTKLTETFKSTLEMAGSQDEELVAQVGAEVRKLLKDKVPAGAHAEEAGTEALSAAENLDGAKSEDMKNEQRGKEVAGKAKAAAKSLSESKMEGMAKDGSKDAQFAQMAQGKGDEGELLERVSRLAGNVNAGRMGFLEGSGGEGIAKLRQRALERSQSMRRSQLSAYRFDAAQHKALTEGIHERDKEKAQGEAWTREGASGETSQGEASAEIARPSALLMPPEPEKPVESDVEAKEAYKPEFKTVRFNAVPFVSEPVKLDGDLAEWKDITGVQMYKTLDGGKVGSLKVVEPQIVKVAWDNTGFFFAYDVKDADGQIKKVQPGNFWEGDAVEIWFDALNTKDQKRGANWAQQFWVWPFGAQGDDAKTGGEAVKDDPKKEWSWVAYGPEQLRRAAKQTADGWTMEVHIPRERLKRMDLVPGKIIGFNLSICTGTPLYYYWGGNSDVRTSERPDTWGDVLLSGSDGKLDLPAHLAQEAQAPKPGETEKPLRALVIGEPLRVRVADLDMNLDDSKKDKVSVTLKSRHGDTEVAILEETGEKTGIFEGSVRTALQIGEPVPGTLSLYEGEGIEVVYDDQARANGARNVSITRKLTVAAGIVGLAAGN
ncbi:MAG: hypothetical protein AMXMBFR7_07100 [Planctomycetota bacterium]